jgi:hypothetical protein
MTQDETIEMARYIASSFGTRMCDENGDTHGEELYAMGIDDIVQTIKLLADIARGDIAEEREACAKVCDALAEPEVQPMYYRVAAQKIRARSNT